MHQVSTSQFRLIASVVRNPSVASTCGFFALGVTFLSGGFIIQKCKQDIIVTQKYKITLMSLKSMYVNFSYPQLPYLIGYSGAFGYVR